MGAMLGVALSAGMAFVGGLLLLIAGLVYAPGDWMRAHPETAGMGAEVAVPALATSYPAADASRVQPRRECASCGVVELIRPIEAQGDLPSRFEFHVWMRDGSLRTSTVDSAGSWQAGDRIMLIGD